MKIGRNDLCLCGSGKKYKNCCIDLDYYAGLFSKQSNLMQQLIDESVSNEVIQIGKKIVSAKKKYTFTTGAYTNMANAYLHLLSREDSLEKAIVMVDKALELKPKNYQAMLVKYSACMLSEKYNDAHIVLKGFCGVQLTNEMKNQILTLYQQIINKFMCVSVKSTELESLYIISKTLFDIMGDYPPLWCLAHEFYRGIGDDALKAYEFGKKCVESWENAEVLSSLGITCINDSINKPVEGIMYLKRAIELTDKKEVIVGAKTNLVSALIMNKNYDEARLLVESLLYEEPNNANFSNYAELLKREGKYEDAIEWCKKALFMVEDDTTLLVLADTFKKNLQYEEAAKTFIKCIATIESQANYYSFTDTDSKKLYSYATDSSLQKMVLEAYRGLVESYSCNNEFTEAKAYLTIGLENYPEDRSLESLGMMLPVANDIQSEYERAKGKLEKEKEISMMQRNSIRKWASDLMVLQNESLNYDLDDEHCWEQFEEQMNQVILNMKESTVHNEELLSDIKQNIEGTYPDLIDKAKELLRTANYLYELNKDALIDFAPIIVEYSKIVEVQLRFKLRDFLSSKEKMLGQIIGKIYNDNIVPYTDNLENLKNVNDLRKDSAHTGVLTIYDADKVRRILFEDGLLVSII